MNIKDITNSMNEEKVRKEAAVALFNALGPKHIATAEAYLKLADIYIQNDRIHEAYDYYTKAYDGFSSYFKNNLSEENLDFIKMYFLLCDTVNDTQMCENLLDLYFERVSNVLIDDKEDEIDTEDMNDVEVSEYLENSLLNSLLPQYKDTLLNVYEGFLNYIIFHYEQDDTDFLMACKTYDDYLEDFIEANAVDTEACRMAVQKFVEENQLGRALHILFTLFTKLQFDEAEEGKLLGDALFELVNFINSIAKDNDDEIMENLLKARKAFNRTIKKQEDLDITDLYDFIFKYFGEDMSL